MNVELKISTSKFQQFEDLWDRKPSPFQDRRYGEAFYKFFELENAELAMPEIKSLKNASYKEVRAWALNHCI